MLLVFLSTFLPFPATGQDEGTPDTGSKDGVKLDEFHEKWSLRVLKAADSIDSFFGNERIENDAQKTRVRLRLDSELKQDEDDEFRASLSAKISLPGLSNRWSLIVGGDDDGDEFRRSGDTIDEQTLAIRFNQVNTLTRNTSFDFGVRRPDGKYRVFGRVRHRKTIPHDKWITRPDNKFYYYNNFGFEYDGTLDFDRVIPPSLMFRASTRVRWWEDDERCNGGWCPEQHFFLYQRFKSPKHVMAYEWSTFLESDPSDGSDDYVEGSVLQLRYRRRTRWEWLFWEVSPGVTFRREHDYDAKGVFLFRLESIFGYQPDYGSLIDFGPERALDD